MAGTERVELPLTEPESAVLPLDEVPICHFVRLSAQGSTIRESSRARNQKFWRSYAVWLPPEPGEKIGALVGHLSGLHGFQELREHHAHAGPRLDAALTDHVGAAHGEVANPPHAA